MALKPRQLAGSAVVFWGTTTLTCTSQIALIAITIGLATNNASIKGSIHRTAWVTAAANMIALTASLAAICLYVRRIVQTVYIILCAVFVVLSILAALLTIYTLTWICNYIQHMKHINQRHEFTQTLTKAGFGLWTVALIAQASLYTLILWPKQQPDRQATPQELTPRTSPGRSVKRRHSDLTSLTPPSTPPHRPSRPPRSGPTSPKLSSPTMSPKSPFGNSVIGPMTSKTKLLLRQSSFPRDSASLQSTRETSVEALRQDDGFENWDTSAIEEADEGHFFPMSTRTRLEKRLETIPGSRPVSPANLLNGPSPNHEDDDNIRLPDSGVYSPPTSPSSETSSFRFSPPPTRPDSSGSQAHIHPLFRSESPGPAPVTSPGTVITASPYAGQVVNPDHHPMVARKLHSSHSFRADSPSPLSPNRSRQSSLRSIHPPQSSHGEQRSGTPQYPRLARSPEPEVNDASPVPF